MADIISNFNLSPYYDTTKEEVEKGYTQFLAVEGRALQNRELNVMHGLAHNNTKKIHDLIIDDGSVVSGCSFINDALEKNCTLTAGEIYANGYLISTPQYTWDYVEVPTTTCVIYYEVYPTVIDEVEDPSLYDPAESYESQGQPGGHRVRFLVLPKIIEERAYSDIILINHNTIKVCKIYNRELYGPTKPKPVFGKLYSYMAQRTYDSLGDFISQGLKVSTKINSNNAQEFYDISISPGRAYVRGYEFNYNKEIKIFHKGAVDTKSNGGTSGIAPYFITYVTGTNKYLLGYDHIKTINVVRANILTTGVTQVFDPITRTNNLPSNYMPIYAIDEVYDYSGAGGAKVTYNLVDDYSIENSNRTLVWKLGGSAPAGTFYVDITISRNLTKEDYQLISENNRSYIQFTDSGIKPKNASAVQVEFTWLLSRIDLVYLSRDGYLRVKSGISANAQELKKPTILTDSLPLAYIYVIPGEAAIDFNIDSFDIYRIPVSQLQNMKKAISNLEYNFAMTELEKLAQNKHLEKESSTTLKNIFADSITNYSNVDFGNSQFDATVDVLRSEVTLPLNIDHITIDDVTVLDQNGNAIDPSIPVMLPVIDKEICDFQPYATHIVDLAPYLFRAMTPIAECSPAKLSHITDSNSTKVIWLPNRIIYSSEYSERYITKTELRSHRGHFYTKDDMSDFYKNRNGVKWFRDSVNWKENLIETGYDFIGADGKPMVRISSGTGGSRITGYNGTITYKKDKGNDPIIEVKTQSNIIGEEIVETKKLAYEMIPQPELRSPTFIKISGKNFLPNTEIQLFLNDEVLLNTEFVDAIFEEIKISYDGIRTPISTRSLPPNNERQLVEHSWSDDINEFIPRPNVWRWKYSSSLNGYIIEHASSTVDNLSYLYNKTDKTWKYKYAGGEWTDLEIIPIWLKWVLRSPWLQDSIDTLEDEAKSNTIRNSNVFEPLTNLEYPTNYSEKKLVLIADGYGDFEVVVKLPNKLSTGNHTIVCKSVVGEDFDLEFRPEAITEFLGESYIRHWETEVYKRKIELVKKIIYKTYSTTLVTSRWVGDPVAQTFKSMDPLFLAGIDLFFVAKAADIRSNVFFMIRETSEDGFPTGKTIYEKMLNRNDIIIGDNYPATYIPFEYPVYIEAGKEYAFIIGATTNGYKMLYAKMGNKDLITNQQVLYNAHVTGVMLESSNDSTWSAVQDSDVKYNLYNAIFDLTPRPYYILDVNDKGSFTNQNFTMCNTTIPYTVFDYTDVFTNYRINGEDLVSEIDMPGWSILDVEEKYRFYASPENMTQMNHNIRVVLYSEHYKMSPVVNFGGFESFYGKYKNQGSYIQQPISLMNL